MSRKSNHNELGRRAARSGIDAGVPRWAVVDTSARTPLIDPDSGLPVQLMAGVDSVAIGDFVQGHNTEILRARAAGEIKTDFRPFLLGEAKLRDMLKRGPVRFLDPTHPLTFEKADARYEVFVPKPPRVPPKFKPSGTAYVRRVEAGERVWVELYDKPIPYVVDVGEAVFVTCAHGCVTSRHVKSGAVLEHVHGRDWIEPLMEKIMQSGGSAPNKSLERTRAR